MYKTYIDTLLMLLLIALLPLHDPVTMILCVLLLSLLRLHLLLHLERLRHVQATLDRGTGVDSVKPFGEVLEFTDVYAGPFGPVYPREAGQVGDGAFVADKERTLCSGGAIGLRSSS